MANSVSSLSPPSISDIDVNPNIARSPFSRIPMELTRFVCSHLLSLHDVNNLSVALTKRATIFRLVNDELVWKDRLIQDFGQEALFKVNNGQYKAVYIKNYEAAGNFLKTLPKKDLLLVIDKTVICLRIPPSNVAFYLDSLTAEELGDVFLKSAKFGCVPLVKAIIENDEFLKMIEEGGRPLGHAFGKALESAARNGHTEILKLIIQKKIKIPNSQDSQDYSYPLFLCCQDPNLFYCAISGAKEIMPSDNGATLIYLLDLVADYMETSDLYTLGLDSDTLSMIFKRLWGAFFIDAANKGLIDLMKLIMSRSQFDPIHQITSPEEVADLRSMFIHSPFASRDGRYDQYFRSSRMIDIAFYTAVAIGNVAEVDLILSHPQSAKIDGRILGLALVHASQRGDVEIFRRIISNKGFSDIPVDGEIGLGRAFVELVKTGNVAMMDLLSSTPRFKEISVAGRYSLGHAFSKAAAKGRLGLMQKIRNTCNRLSKFIPVIGEYGLAGAYYKAGKNRRLASMRYIRQLKSVSNLLISNKLTFTMFGVAGRVSSFFKRAVVGCKGITVKDI